MSRRRTDMRKLREIIRLHFESGMSANKIATSVNVARSVVQEYLRRARVHDLSWPLPAGMDDAQLENLLYPITVQGQQYAEPDWQALHEQLKEKGITRELVWLDYKSDCGSGDKAPYSYQQYCRLYQAWSKNISVVMRQEHLAGEKLFVDFAGKTIPVVNPETGEVTFAQIFVAVMGASNYTFVTACESQKIDSWLAAHVQAFRFFGGVPELLIPDNLKSAVTRYHRYEPKLNERYYQFARHFGTTIIPARAGKPKDKAKVEKGVQFVETWIIGVLRKHTFFSFEELNKAISELLYRLNEKKFKKLSGCRRSWFETLDRPALKQLPLNNFEDAEWLELTVGADYHVEVNRHFYSVPYTLKHKRVQARLTPTILEILYKGTRVASHIVRQEQGKASTIDEHRPTAHQAVSKWTVERLLNWAARVGPGTKTLCAAIIDNSRHPSVGIQASLGLLSMHKEFGPERLEAACRHANQSGGWTIRNIRAYLKNGMDKRNVQLAIPDLKLGVHENVRGESYYVSTQEYPTC